MRRREFLANLLFAGGLLTVGGLQAQYPTVARKDPEKEGWQLPKDWKEKNEEDGWEIPDDLMQPTEPPAPQPPPKPPEPMPNGGIRQPDPRGRYLPPKPLPGKVKLPKTP